eukprot:347468-Rhodomonas_salina.1
MGTVGCGAGDGATRADPVLMWRVRVLGYAACSTDVASAGTRSLVLMWRMRVLGGHVEQGNARTRRSIEAGEERAGGRGCGEED